MVLAAKCLSGLRGRLSVPKKNIYYWIAAFTGIALVLLGVTFCVYASARTLPAGVTLAGWEAGGLTPGEAEAVMERRMEELASVPLTLISEGKTVLTLTLREAGAEYAATALSGRLDVLRNGSLWQRAQARRSIAADWPLEIHLDTGLLRERLGLAWEREAFGDPVNAEREITKEDEIRYHPETHSRRIDWALLEQAIAAALPRSLEKPVSGDIALELPLATLEAPVTVRSLKAEGVERKIAEFSTSLGASGPGRVHNVKAAAAAVDGTVLAPGAVFDYGKAIEKAQAETGFREAPVIVGGRLQPGVGGGICQVSSTLYNAAIRVGLEMVERQNHSVPVNYLPKGQDATFAQGYINFRFRNNTGKWLVIRTEVKGKVLTVKLFGSFPRNVTYTLESKTVEILPPRDQAVADASVPPGGTRVLRKGRTGYIVETYITKRTGGASPERSLLSRDTYPAQMRQVAVHPSDPRLTGQRHTPAKALMEDGVKAR